MIERCSRAFIKYFLKGLSCLLVKQLTYNREDVTPPFLFLLDSTLNEFLISQKVFNALV